jgi:hypothetical protein
LEGRKYPPLTALVHYKEVSNKNKSKHVGLAQQNGFGPTFFFLYEAEAGKRHSIYS